MNCCRTGPGRAFLLLAVVAMALFTTGCGTSGGGGGGDTNNPVSPLAPTASIIVDGYVSSARAAGSVRAATANPLRQIEVRLINLDESGVEQVIERARTGDDGHYRMTIADGDVSWRNLIVQAVASGAVLEGVVPMVRAGGITVAPTIDPSTAVQAIIVREAARTRRQRDINVGEVLAVLPPAILEQVASRVSELVGVFVAREAEKQTQYGAASAQLKDYSFTLQQRINEAVARGELSTSEAWTVFAREMKEKARELGVPPENTQAVDDYDQTNIVDRVITTTAADGSVTVQATAGATTGAGTPGTGPRDPEVEREAERVVRERVRARQLQLLETIENAVQVLHAERPFADHDRVVTVMTKARETLAVLQDVGELRAFFRLHGTLMLDLGNAIGRLLADNGFTPALVARVGAAGSGNASSDASEVAQAVGLDHIYARVVSIVRAANLALSATQLKAIASILWAMGDSNLACPVPLVPEPEQPRYATVCGKVVALASDQVVATGGYRFTHKLAVVNNDPVVTSVSNTVSILNAAGAAVTTSAGAADAVVGGSAAGETVIAYLAEEGPFAVAIEAARAETVETGSLERLAARGDLVEVSGQIVVSPVLADPGPAVGGANSDGTNAGSTGSAVNTSTGAVAPGAVAPGAVTVVTTAAGQTVTSVPVGMRASEIAPIAVGQAVPPSPPVTTVVTPMAPVNRVLFMVVKKARVLPPPAPAPIAFDRVAGTIAQAMANGRPVAGVYVFSTTVDTRLDQAVVKTAVERLDDPARIALDRWVGRPVLMSGVLVQGDDAPVIWVKALGAVPR